jgi:hypothetical protein
VGYQAVKALRAAVDSIDPLAYPQLLQALGDAQRALVSSAVGFDTDRQTVLREAEAALRETIGVLSANSFP